MVVVFAGVILEARSIDVVLSELTEANSVSPAGISWENQICRFVLVSG